MKLSYPTMMATLCLAENFSVGRAFTPTGYSTSSCSTGQQYSAYTSLAAVLTKDFFQGCTDDSKYSLLYSTSIPSDTEWPLFCSSTNCQALVDLVLVLSPPDCILTVPTSGLEINVFAFVDSFDDHCDAILNPTTVPTPTPAPTSTAEPTTDEPTTDEPSTDEPSTDEPSTDEPTTDEPTTDEPTTDEPSTDEPTTDEPTTDEPSTDEPTTDEPSTPTVTAAPHLSCGGDEQ